MPAPLRRALAARGFDRAALRLMFCGLSALYWELVLIRWLASCVRVVAYYSNFVLIAAFFGLGAGALLTRFEVRLHRWLVPALGGTLSLGLLFGDVLHLNPESADEFVWLGTPRGVLPPELLEAGPPQEISVWVVLPVVYLLSALAFLIFGQWLGRLFKSHPPLWAYSVEIFGSLVGIGLFAALSALGATPVAWFAVGFALLLPIVEPKLLDRAVVVVGGVGICVLAAPFAERFVWSPYYRISVRPLTSYVDVRQPRLRHFEVPMGHTLTVNNDYHQMMLDLRPRDQEADFLRSWRTLYDHPYAEVETLPKGPILVVGAGTGNDVSAALRNTDREIVAVEIDPRIVDLGRRLHAEKPYDNPRVKLVVNDARTFFRNTTERFAMVVFGFLDSHTLLSSYSSLRLDNFVYTEESMQQVRRILLPGGAVHLTFASNRQWIHDRIIALLNGSFDAPTATRIEHGGYANGVIYSNRKLDTAARSRRGKHQEAVAAVLTPTDDWPFLYLRRATIPGHYLAFMALALVLGSASLLFLPRGQRRVRVPYFLLGAGFFLIETSNVASLSILFGSTWYTNVLVFAGILVLVLVGNWTSYRLAHPRIGLVVACLAVNIAVAYATPVSALLSIDSSLLRAATAVLVFLGPVYFASLIFATLIKKEAQLYQAYGSNVLGAVVGGVCEYLSLVVGFKALLGLTLCCYLVVLLLLRTGADPPATRATPVPG